MSTPPSPLPARLVSGLLLIAMTLLCGGTLAYIQWAPAMLAKLDLSVGEVLMKEGLRLEEAGATESAMERYRAALAARFAGEQNRVYTLKLLGTLLWGAKDYDAALPLLREAVESPEASPSFFPPYCDTLLHLKRADDLAAAATRWQQLAARSGDEADMAEAKYFEGRAALALGEPARAKAAFTEGLRLHPGGKNAAELAQMAYEEQDYPAALRHIDAYLDSGASGERAAQLRALRGRITKMVEKP